jgi:hypothetical protein
MSKPAYERPLFVRHQVGLMNKLSAVQLTRPQTEIDGFRSIVSSSNTDRPCSSSRRRRWWHVIKSSTTRFHSNTQRFAWPGPTRRTISTSICRVFHSRRGLC